MPILPYSSVLKCELSLTQENSAVYNCEQTDKINIICSKTEGFSSKTLHDFEQIFKKLKKSRNMDVCMSRDVKWIRYSLALNSTLFA